MYLCPVSDSQNVTNPSVLIVMTHEWDAPLLFVP